ncbi:hypothetical protein [Gluconobacter japonicus]|uniref:hypothetical protein n=1 Tax=Gluconobacter japonicus TaxID=376620 RepID=UPI0039EC0B8A
MKQARFLGIEKRLARLIGLDGQFKAFSRTVDFEVFRLDLKRTLAYPDGSKSEHPPFESMRMFKILMIQTLEFTKAKRQDYGSMPTTFRIPVSMVAHVKGKRGTSLRRYLSEHAKTDIIDAQILIIIPSFGEAHLDNADHKFSEPSLYAQDLHGIYINYSERIFEIATNIKDVLAKIQTIRDLERHIADLYKHLDPQAFLLRIPGVGCHLTPMLCHIQKSNAVKSVIQPRVEYVFADQQSQTRLFARSSVTQSIIWQSAYWCVYVVERDRSNVIDDQPRSACQSFSMLAPVKA